MLRTNTIGVKIANFNDNEIRESIKIFSKNEFTKNKLENEIISGQNENNESKVTCGYLIIFFTITFQCLL